jgi:Domain of unknown function (DUF4265)
MKPEIATHSNPVWRDEADFLIAAELDPEACRQEQLWAKKMAPQEFKLCCIPFFTYGYALGDVVETTRDFVIIKRIISSGRKLVRFWLRNTTEDARRRFIELLNEREVLSEARGNLIAVDFSNEFEHNEFMMKFEKDFADTNICVEDAG